MFMQMCIHGFNISEQTVRFLKLEEAKKKNGRILPWQYGPNILQLETYIQFTEILNAQYLHCSCNMSRQYLDHHLPD